MKYIVAAVLIGIWIYVLYALKRSKLNFWLFITGSFGLFLILMTMVRPWLTMPLAQCVAAIAGIVGNLTGTYDAYFKYGVLFIQAGTGAVTLRIDLECSGIIEISAFLSLLAFFGVYDISERILVGILGTIYTILGNAFRITLICLMVQAYGTDVYYIAHTFVGRIVFYVLQVLMYFLCLRNRRLFTCRLEGSPTERMRTNETGNAADQSVFFLDFMDYYPADYGSNTCNRRILRTSEGTDTEKEDTGSG